MKDKKYKALKALNKTYLRKKYTMTAEEAENIRIRILKMRIRTLANMLVVISNAPSVNSDEDFKNYGKLILDDLYKHFNKLTNNQSS